VEQLADQRLDPAQRPALVNGEPLHQRPLPQFLFQPGPLMRQRPPEVTPELYGLVLVNDAE